MKKRSYLFMLLPYLSRFKWRIIISLAIVVAGRLFSVTNPYVIKELVDTLAESTGFAIDIRYLAVLVLLFFMLRWGTDLLSGLKDYIFAKVTVGVKRLVSLDVFSHLLSLPVEFHTEQATGGVARKISRGTSAISSLSFFLTGSILPTLIEIVLVLGIFITLFPPIFGLVFGIFVVIYVAFTVIVTNRRQKLLLETNKRDDRGSEQSIDALMNYETVKYFTNEEFEFKRYESTLKRWADMAIVSTKKGANLNMGQGLILTAGLTALLALAVREYLNGAATVGDFVLITTYLNRVAIPLSFLGMLYRRLKESLANVDEMFKLLEVENDVVDRAGAKELENPEGHIVLTDVVFGYKDNRSVLKGVSIDIPARSSVALVGSSGSGKSTVSKLLLRLYDVSGGEISIDGADIRNITQVSLRRNIGVVAQDTILFNETIFNNIQYGRPGAGEEDIVAAAKLANIHEFIESLPEGYDTQVGERGVKLSGGEKQRVAIARMLLKDPPILLFDEATASLDSKSERRIQDAIKSVSQKGKTTIVIAHRLSTIVDFDKIVVLDQGKVIEEGTHEELLKTCGAYQKLWRLQNSSQK
ncbi:MAG: ABC transporter ATP-binding protein/permease [Candidatus Marinimicrobia bacterium]|nr:ABC transporter ATP-binding protein/permease [Candidatus Neomarinimicrobiota bacterium]